MSEKPRAARKGPALYYAIAALIAAVAIGLGAWFVLETRTGERSAYKASIPEQSKGLGAPSSSTGPTKGGSAPASSPALSVSASDADLERISREAEQDLAEIEGILNEADRIYSGQDNDVNNI